MSSNDFGPPPMPDQSTFLRYPLGTGAIVNLSVSYYFKSFKTFLSHLIPFLINWAKINQIYFVEILIFKIKSLLLS